MLISGKSLCAILLIVSASALLPLYCNGQASVLTHHNDNGRTGQNLNETMLTPANVNAASFGRLFNQPVDGSIVGQPLYVPNVRMSDGTTHNVVFVATQHDSVYAFDADNNIGTNADPLWTVHYSNPVPEDDEHFGCGTPGYTEVGITGTPVIDPASSTLYVVSKTIENKVYFFRLHALDLASGAEKFGGPMPINATVQTSQGTITFNPPYQMQRPALLLLKGTVYIGFGSNGCDAFDYHGWLFGYSASTLQQQGIFVSTPGGLKGALWAAGGGPAADSQGFIYISTGNGTFDVGMGGTDLGDSMVKLNTVQKGFTVQDYFTPYDQATLFANDLDLGSGGLVVLPDQSGSHKHELVGGGKEGTLYLIDRDEMGQFNAVTDLVVQEFPHVTTSIKTVPAYWNGKIYLSGQKDYLKMFTLSGGVMSSDPVQQTSVFFSDRGPSLSISANGNNDGILWVMSHGSPILYAFDATNLSNQLWDTTQALQLRDRIASTSRFVTPTVVNGKVYLGGVKLLNVFGLLPSLAITSGDGQSGTIGTALSAPLTMRATDSYTQAGIPGVSLSCKDGGAGGTLSNPTGVTDSFGNFTTTYTLPVKAKTVTITCKATGYASSIFTETAVAGAAHAIRVFSGNLQTAPVNTMLAAPLVVKVVDSHFNPVPGAVVTFSDGGKGGTFTTTTTTTDVSGLAQTSYTTPGAPGTVRITAGTGSLKPCGFKITVTAN